MPFKEGDLVELKSGGARMVVAKVDGSDVHCIWQEKRKGTGEIKPMREVYPAVVLQAYKERSIVF